MTLFDAKELTEYTIKSINTNNEEVRNFLFSLGFVIGETATVILKQKHGIVVLIKESRYSLDREIAETIEI